MKHLISCAHMLMIAILALIIISCDDCNHDFPADTDTMLQFDSDACADFSDCSMGLMYDNGVNACPDYIDYDGMPCVVCVNCILVSPEFDDPCDSKWKAVGFVY